VVYPSNPYDAKGLLLASFEDPNPIIYFEHKLLYRSIEQDIPDEYYTVEIGKARTVREGSKASIITYGMGVHWAEAAVNELGVDVEIIDLRTLLPLDYAAIDATLMKTNRVLLLHEDTMIAGVAAELSAYISEHLFEYLDAPVIRIASLDTAIPFTTVLEKNFLASARLKDGIERLLGY
jgi:2-oxoisovalerate dehydrogenase E1 component